MNPRPSVVRQQQLNRPATQVEVRQVHARQAWIEPSCDVGIVEGDHGQVIGNAQTDCRGCLVDAHRGTVVHGDHRGGPEFMGSHIASVHSHTTGRRHDLGFRAATTIFGHLGVEWDLTEATDPELAELSAWIEFYKNERGLLLGGDLVRMDGADPRLIVHGVVATDRSRAIFAAASTDNLYPDPPARLTFRGLDPERRYRVRPVLVGSVPSGLRPPTWWGGPADVKRDLDEPRARPTVSLHTVFPGALFTGSALDHVGVACPRTHPDQVVLYRADATEGAGQAR